MSAVPNTAFRGSAAAAANLWGSWLEVARRQHGQVGSFPLGEIQTLCEQVGWLPPELEAFARVCDQPPGILLCGGDAPLAMGVASLFGFELDLPPVSAGPVIWRVTPEREPSLKLRLNSNVRDIPRAALAVFLGRDRSTDDPIEVQETLPGSSLWQFLWLPHPGRITGRRPAELELLLAQRAAVVIVEDTPIELVNVLNSLGQKLWPVARRDLETAEDRQRLLHELATLREDRLEEISLRASAARNWLRSQLLVQTTDRKHQHLKLLGQYDHHLNTTRHLLMQYRTHWTSGVRSLAETHFQTRMNAAATAALYDPQKPGPSRDSFLSAMALTALATRLEEFVNDRMADFVAGLTGLAAKIELRSVSLGDAKACWAARALFPRLDQLLGENHMFAAETRKRGGLTATLTGKRQGIIDERKAQTAKATRLVINFLVHEFVEWSGALINSVEQGITVQLAAALTAKGAPSSDSLRATVADLECLERLLEAKEVNSGGPEEIVQAWFHHVAPRSKYR